MEVVVRVSVIRCEPEQFSQLRRMMADCRPLLEPGIREMAGLIHFYAGADEATSSLTNVSVWRSLADARRLDGFQPMLDLGREFVLKGATFERPIMNYASLWEVEP
jgi:hypothetical protein